MQRYVVSRFDGSAFVVIDQTEMREVCVCSEYDEREEYKEHAVANRFFCCNNL